MLVLKFGGTSVGSAERFEGVLKIVFGEKGEKKGDLVVLSAMSGITNALIAAAEKAMNRDLALALKELEGIREKHAETVKALISDEKSRLSLLEEIKAELDELEIILKGISYLGELSKRSLDTVSGVGEVLSSKIFAHVAQHRGYKAKWVDARKVIVTDNAFGRANPLMDQIEKQAAEIISPLVKSGHTVITQGFIGATLDGARTTLGRGGSDYSAALLGVALGAEEIQIWTDVDGMLTADPRLVPEATVLPEVTFQEASELAYFGAKVLHPLTIKPAVEKNIPVRILNTMSPEKKGTIIKETATGHGLICAIASKKGISAVFISSPRMLMAHGFLARVFDVFDRYRTPIDLISTSEVSISLTTDRTDELDAVASALSEYGEVRTSHDVAIVTVVGRQFREKSGIASQVFSALKEINIIMISGGASDINLSFVVSREDADRAVRQLHQEFFTPAKV